MPYAILVNNIDELIPRQTTTMLIQSATRFTEEVWVIAVETLSCQPSGEVMGYGKRVPKIEGREAFLAALKQQPSQSFLLDTADLVLIRTNPGRDLERAWAHHFALDVLEILEEKGVLVLNRPQGLKKASTKLYLHAFPEHIRPKTLISRNVDHVRAFIEALSGPAVLKPLQGSRGRDVFMVSSPDDKNLHQIIDVLARNGLPMVQAFVPEALEGDTRVVVMDGQILEVGEHAVAVRRIPGSADFRSNIHAGGHPAQATITPAIRAMVKTIGPQLVQDGLFLVGLDLIGTKLVEINVFSTGGFYDAERYAGITFTEQVWTAIEEKLRWHQNRSQPHQSRS